MAHLEIYTVVFLIIQALHSLEELTQGFHRKVPFLSLKFETFLAFEVLFMSFWLVVFFLVAFPYRETFLASFILWMFANGIWHLAWGIIDKKYVPGVVTAPLFIIAFVFFLRNTVISLIPFASNEKLPKVDAFDLPSASKEIVNQIPKLFLYLHKHLYNYLYGYD